MKFTFDEKSRQIAIRSALRPGERVIASAYGHIDGFKYSFIGHMFIFMLVFTLTLVPVAYAFEYIDSKVTLCIVCAISTAVCTTIMFFIDIAFTGSVIGTRNLSQTKYGFFILTDNALKIVIMYTGFTNNVRDVYEIPYTSIKNIRKKDLKYCKAAFVLELDPKYRDFRKHTCAVKFRVTSPRDLPYQSQNVETISRILNQMEYPRRIPYSA